jgi:L-lysine 2,3-aminomutase
VWPGERELIEAPGFLSDPLAERTAARAPGLLQKYLGRALLISTGAPAKTVLAAAQWDMRHDPPQLEC